MKFTDPKLGTIH